MNRAPAIDADPLQMLLSYRRELALDRLSASAYRAQLVRKRALLLNVRGIIAFRPTRVGTQYRRRGRHRQRE